MLTTNTELIAAYKEILRELDGGVDIYDGSTVASSILSADNLISIKIERTSPSGKFFGFAVTQKMTIEVIGKLTLAKDTKLHPYIKIQNTTAANLPFFYVKTVEVDETANKTTITAYDIIEKADHILIKDILENITYPLTINSFANTVLSAFGAVDNNTFMMSFNIQEQPNFAGTETLRDVLVSIAEATGTICYCSSGDSVVFRTLLKQINDTLDGEQYFNFASQDLVTLEAIATANALGDNIYVGLTDGWTQVIWDNPFLMLREDITTILEQIGELVIGLSTNPFELKGRGNPFYEIGDRLAITTIKNEVKNVYYFNDTLEYKGGLKSMSEWIDSEQENLNAAPSSLGVILNQTFAKVDKVNGQIELVVNKTEILEEDLSETQETISSLQMTSDSITNQVQRIQTTTNEQDEKIQSLTQTVEQTMSADNVQILIKEELSNIEVNQVTTQTGFTFNAEGLTIDKSNSEMSTQITEDGMTISKNEDVVLTVNNVGVNATNLHATTYLIIGETSRFEDYTSDTGELRTGCFWIHSKSEE